MRTPNNRFTQSGSKYWGTTQELEYLENIGTFGNVSLTEKQMLQNYLNPIYPKVDWGMIDKGKVLEFAKKRLANLREGK